MVETARDLSPAPGESRSNAQGELRVGRRTVHKWGIGGRNGLGSVKRSGDKIRNQRTGKKKSVNTGEMGGFRRFSDDARNAGQSSKGRWTTSFGGLGDAQGRTKKKAVSALEERGGKKRKGFLGGGSTLGL